MPYASGGPGLFSDRVRAVSGPPFCPETAG